MQPVTDRYPDLESLKKELREGVDFRVRILDRGSNVTIIAPHGGLIEPGTSALARAIAGRDYNLFDFQGLHDPQEMDLHVTSTHFREPGLTALLKTSEVAVSIHGMEPNGSYSIWLGGLNTELKDRVLRELVGKGFSVDPDSPRYRGRSPKNIVNLAPRKGVQVELPENMRVAMFTDGRAFGKNERDLRRASSFRSFVVAVRKAIRGYCSSAR